MVSDKQYRRRTTARMLPKYSHILACQTRVTFFNLQSLTSCIYINQP